MNRKNNRLKFAVLELFPHQYDFCQKAGAPLGAILAAQTAVANYSRQIQSLGRSQDDPSPLCQPLFGGACFGPPSQGVFFLYCFSPPRVRPQKRLS
jgi:hypothetical protein